MAMERIAPIVNVTPFNVTAGSYETFINSVRGALAGPTHLTVVGPTSGVARPVLSREPPAKYTQPSRWIHVQLNGYKGVAPKLAIRSDNAYVMGFTNSRGTWFQLDKTECKHKLVADKAVMVGFDGNYSSLLGSIHWGHPWHADPEPQQWQRGESRCHAVELEGQGQ